MPKVVITPRSYGLYSPEISKVWQDAGFEVIIKPGPHEEANLCELVADADALLVGTDKVSRAVIHSARSLKFIAKYGVGVDNIDVDYARNHGVEVSNTPGVNTEAVADYTFGLLLSLARKIPQSHSDLIEGKWSKTVGLEIWGKTLGIIGLGAIGKAVAKRAKGFDMQIIAFDLYPDPAFAEANQIAYLDFESVIRKSDVLTVHMALSEDTRHLIAGREFGWMKENTLLINTARGGIVDEDALFEALSGRVIAGAALDVFESEPLGNSRLTTLDNILLTPHNAAASVEAIRRMTEQSTDQVLQYFQINGNKTDH
jgi:D-3-phosphoglycerate dehydrogenase / 2-oxoglutarate reductase